MPNRRRSASRSASPSHSRSRTRHDNGPQRDGDNDEEQIENLNENVQGIENQGVDGDNQNNNENVGNENIGDGPVIEPVDTELLPIMNRLSEIGVDQLEGDESNKLNLNRVYIDV